MDAIDQSIESKTIHGIVDGHVARVNQGCGPLTIRDHLITDGVNDLPLLNSLYRQIFQGLKVGGDFHDRLGSVYLLNQHRGGRQPEGFGDDPPFGHDKLKMDPSKALIVRDLYEIADGPFQMRTSGEVVVSAARTLASVPSRAKQEKITAGFVSVDQEMEMLRQKVAHMEETNEFLRRENEMLRTGRIATALPTQSANAAPGRRASGTVLPAVADTQH